MDRSVYKSHVFHPCFVRVLLFSLSFVLLISSFSVTVAENHTITDLRAGFWNFDGYHNMDENGKRSGYGYDLLQLISLYANVHFTYLAYDKTLGESLDLLEKGEIDLLSGVKKTPERIEKFDFSSRSVGETSTIITIKAGNLNVISGNYKTYNGLRIGLISDGIREKEMDLFATLNGFSYTPVHFSTTQEMSQALQTGEVDALVSSSLRKLKNEWTIDVFNESPIYIAVRKGDTKTLGIIDEALNRMELEEYHWRNDLSLLYYNAVQTTIPFLTEHEREFLKELSDSGKVFSVLVNPDRYPYSYIENNQLKGIMVDLFDRIAEYAGIQYEWFPVKNREEYAGALHSNKADICIDLSPDYDSAEKAGYKITNMYLSAPFSWVRRNDSSGDIKTASKLTYTVHTPAQYAYDNNFHDIVYISYLTEEECIESVLNGETDGFCIYTYNAEKLVMSDTTRQLMCTVANTTNQFTIGVSNKIDYRLATILNTAISCIEDWEKTEITRRYTSLSKPDYSLVDLIRHDARTRTIFILLLFVSLFFILFIQQLLRNRVALNRTINTQNQRLEDSLQNLLDALAAAIEFRSSESGEHIHRTREIVLTILKKLQKSYPKDYPLTNAAIIQIANASVLHDVGKISIPDHILNKPGKLTTEEDEVMKQHCVKGCALLETIPDMQYEPLYRYAWDICRWHHERWDGAGYPDGLKADEIPIWAQVAAIADVYDALTSHRVYKKAYSSKEAIKMILNGECGAFNPKLLNVFASVAEKLSTSEDVDNPSPVRAPASRSTTSLILNAFQTFLTNTDNSFFVKDPDLVYRSISPTFAQFAGLPVEKILYHKDSDFVTSEKLLQRFISEDEYLLNNGGMIEGPTELLYVKDGLSFYGKTTKYLIQDNQGRTTGILGITKDLTAQYFAQRHHQITLKYLHYLAENMYFFICFDITTWQILGEKRQSIRNCEFPKRETLEEFAAAAVKNISDRRGPAFSFYSNFNQSALMKLYDENQPRVSMEYIRCMPDGSRRWVRDEISFLIDPLTGHLCLTIAVSDIQKKKEDELRLIEQAEHDSLTGLLNRSSAVKLVNERLRYDEHEKHALFFIDIDNFKLVNDTLGHIAGDKFLSSIGRVITDCFRATDIIGRIGGDEFIILMTNIADRNHVEEKAKQLTSAFGVILDAVFDAMANADVEESISKVIDNAYNNAKAASQNQKSAPRVSASIGISLFPNDGVSREELYAHADEAMYSVKRGTKNGYLFYEDVRKEKETH